MVQVAEVPLSTGEGQLSAPWPSGTEPVKLHGTGAKVAVTVVAALTGTVHAAWAPAHPPPLQPLKVEPGAGVAVRITDVPSRKGADAAEQASSQRMAAGVETTVPCPVPLFCTVSVWSVPIPSESTAALSVVSLSWTPAGGATSTWFTSVPAPEPSATLPLTTYVTVAPAGRVTGWLMFPEPDPLPHVPPAPVQVQVGLGNRAGKVS